MCEAGRIRHHLKHNLWNRKSSIVFVGYQAEGTLGRMLLDGAKEVTLFGEKIQVKRQNIRSEGFSGHADKNGLLDWLKGFRKEPKHIFLVHGEPDAKEAFADTVRKELGYEPVVVTGNSEFVLEKDEIVNMEQAMKEAADEETRIRAKNNLADIHGRIEDILYNANLALEDDISPQRLAKINNIVLELEKSTINLGAALSEEDRGASEEVIKEAAVNDLP